MAYDQEVTLPMWAAKLIRIVVKKVGLKELEYVRFSMDSDFTRNYLYLKRNYSRKLPEHVPEFVKRIVGQY